MLVDALLDPSPDSANSVIDGKTVRRQRSDTSPRNVTCFADCPHDQQLFDLAENRLEIAVQHMSTYWGILEKMRGSKLRLTRMDDEIHDHFKRDFPDFDPGETIDEDAMKSKEGKDKWRNFMKVYEKKVDDYNFGTLLRANPKFEYGEKETIFGQP